MQETTQKKIKQIYFNTKKAITNFSTLKWSLRVIFAFISRSLFLFIYAFCKALINLIKRIVLVRNFENKAEKYYIYASIFLLTALLYIIMLVYYKNH